MFIIIISLGDILKFDNKSKVKWINKYNFKYWSQKDNKS